MKALFICENLMEYITREKIVQGRIHSVFSKACNIETDRYLITLLSKDKQMAPMSLIIDHDVQIDFKRLDIRTGYDVYFSVNDIYIPDRNLLIELSSASGWSPYLKENRLLLKEEELIENISIMEDTLRTYGKLQSMAPLFNQVSREFTELNMLYIQEIDFYKGTDYIANKFLKFFKCAASGDIENIAQKSEEIIGFGQGLTPSVDDFTSGLMISLISLGSFYKLNEKRIYEFNKELISRCLHRTTRISAEMLKHSASGETNEAVKELVQAMLCEKEEVKIIKALINTINFGETSGSDTALGIYAGCKLLTNLKYRRVWKSEAMCGN